MLANLSTNDLKSFKKHIENNYDDIKNDIASIKYAYSVEPNIYTVDTTKKIVKLNPKNLFRSSFGTSSFMGSLTSIYSQMNDDIETLNNSYDILEGHWPQKYNEMVLVLVDRNSISDFVVYSLGLRDTDELTNLVSKIMNGEQANINNEPLNISYEDILNKEFKLVLPTNLYKYNDKYDIYEDMSLDNDYLKTVYENSENLKIVGIVTAKEGVTTTALNPGISYTSDLIDYIISKSSQTDIVKKQLENQDIDVLSGNRFDAPKDNLSLDFKDFVSIDSNKLKSAFNINIDETAIQKQAEGFMREIANSVIADLSTIKKEFLTNLKNFSYEILENIKEEKSEEEIKAIVDKYLKGKRPTDIFNKIKEKYGISNESIINSYSGALKSIAQEYANYEKEKEQNEKNDNGSVQNLINEITEKDVNNIAKSVTENSAINREKLEEFIDAYIDNPVIQKTADAMAKDMLESFTKKYVLNRVGAFMGTLSQNIGQGFNVDAEKIASAFQMNMSEEELTRIVNAMLSKTETTAKTNLKTFGYQDKDEPTYISFYFRSFDGKEHFKSFIEEYNNAVKSNGKEDKEINYTDTTGILMESVKTIVNAVTYVLIAFISISLVVSSIMIGVITYISVYERTKEIGILRAIGASKHNISSIFNAETFIIGLLSGLFGIGITYSLIPIINAVLHHFAGNIPLRATFYPQNAIVLVILSIILTLLGGLIPAKAASKKDPVIALRTE